MPLRLGRQHFADAICHVPRRQAMIVLLREAMRAPVLAVMADIGADHVALAGSDPDLVVMMVMMF